MPRTCASQVPIAVPPLGRRPSTARIAAALVVVARPRRPPVCGVDAGGLLGAGDDREVGAVDEFVDGGRGGPFRRVELARRRLHRGRAVDDDGLDPLRAASSATIVASAAMLTIASTVPAALGEIGIVVDVDSEPEMPCCSAELMRILRSGSLRR